MLKKIKSLLFKKPSVNEPSEDEIIEKITTEVESNIKELNGLIEWYWVDKPWAAIAITRDFDNTYYRVITPYLNDFEYIILNKVHQKLIDKLCLINEEPALIFNKEASKLIRFYSNLDRLSEAKIIYYLRRKCLGYDSIDPILKDPLIEDISCNGPNLPIYVYHVGYGFIPTNISFTQTYLNDFVSHLAEVADRHISVGFPVVEATLPDGSRLTAFWMKEISDRGSGFSIRKVKAEPFTPFDLVRLKTFSSEAIALLWLCVEFGINMMIIGGTASGKTTTLNALCSFIPKNKRIISIEDTRELKLNHKNWVPLVVREEKKVEGLNDKIDAMYLLKRALRMRAEYLIVGEVRGEEARILFQAMNTGHIVYSTMHAGSAYEAFTRLFNPPILVPPATILPLDLVIVQSLIKIEDHTVRRCIYIGELSNVDVENKKVEFNTIASWSRDNDSLTLKFMPNRVFEKIKRYVGWSDNEILRELEERRKIIENGILKGVRAWIFNKE
ncbi:MAG: type II/IV secretion system ATPase subunit [Nitrososphaerales archaeon]